MRERTLMPICILLAFVLVACGDSGPAAEDGISNQGSTEMRYAARGPFSTNRTSIPGYALFYPATMEDGEHPVITWGNGTFAIPAYYQELLDHFASYGFVVIASTSIMTRSGEEMLGGVDWLFDENGRGDSIFYNKIDTGRVGATGHSQGGGGTINAGTDPRFTCTAPIEPIPGRVQELQGPMFLIAGSNDSLVSAAWVTSSTYDPALVPTIYGIAQGANHLTPLGDAGMMRGYLTAWFCANLLGHEEAEDAFFGQGGNCEICNNASWVVMRKNLP